MLFSLPTELVDIICSYCPWEARKLSKVLRDLSDRHLEVPDRIGILRCDVVENYTGNITRLFPGLDSQDLSNVIGMQNVREEFYLIALDLIEIDETTVSCFRSVEYPTVIKKLWNRVLDAKYKPCDVLIAILAHSDMLEEFKDHRLPTHYSRTSSAREGIRRHSHSSDVLE